MLHSTYKYFKKLANSNHIKPPAVSDSSLAPGLNHINTNLRVKFDGHCLKQDKVKFTDKQVVIIDIVCKTNFLSYTEC